MSKPNADVARLILENKICNLFEQCWRNQQGKSVEEFLKEHRITPNDRLLLQLLELECDWQTRTPGGKLPTLEYLQQRYPTLASSKLEQLISRFQSRQYPAELGDYKLLREIGRGGMGAVFFGRHRILRRDVAIKLIQADNKRDPEFGKRFLREVRLQAALAHPNIVSVFDARYEQPWLILVAEFIEGINLQDKVKRDGPMDLTGVIPIIMQTLDGLEHAHQAGIIHRDIKPSNLMIDQMGRIRILDFGLARHQSATPKGNGELTKENTILGTLAYMSPEQAQSPQQVDARTDMYSLGCTIYFLLTGKTPFDSDNPVSAIVQHQSSPVPVWWQESTRATSCSSESAIAMQQFLERLMAKKREDRYPTCADARQALRQLIPQDVTLVDRGQSTLLNAIRPDGLTSANPAIDTKLQPSAMPTRQRRYFISMMAAGLLTGALALPIWFSRNGRKEKDPADKPKESEGKSKDLSQEVSPAVSTKTGLLFDGEQSVVDIKAPAMPTDQITFEIVFRIDRIVPAQPANLVCWYGQDWMGMFLSDSANLGIARRNGEQAFVSVVRDQAPMRRWMHFAGTWDGTKVRLFIDGKEQVSFTSSYQMPTTESGIDIGGMLASKAGEHPTNRYFLGAIDALRISRGTIYDKDFVVAERLTVTEATLCCYQFDEAIGSKVNDSGPNRWHGTALHTNWIRW